MRTAAAKLGITLGLVGVAGALIRFSAESAKAAARAEQTEVVFTNLSGSAEAAAENLEAMRRATVGLTTDTDSMAIASQLLGMRIVTTAEELEKVVTVSRRLGAAFRGLGARQAAEEFAMMMSNMSVMRLDTFGISSGRVRTRIQELQAATKDLTREQAFFIATMEEADDTLARLGEEVIPEATRAQQELKVATENVKEAWGDFVTSPVIIGGMETLARLVQDLADGLDAFFDPEIAAVAAEGLLNAENLEDAHRAIIDYSGSMVVLKQALVNASGSQEEYNAALDKLGRSLAPTAAGLRLQTGEWEALTDALGDYADMFTRVEGLRAAMAGPDDRLRLPDFSGFQDFADQWRAIPDQAVEIFVEFQTNLSELVAEQQDALDALRNEWMADEIRANESYLAALAASTEDFQNGQARDLESFQSDQARDLENFRQRESEIEADYYRDRMRFAENHSQDMARLEEDHQTRLREMREDHEFRQDDAIASRDAIAFIRNQRRFERDRRRAEETHNTAAGRRDEDFARRMADMEADFQTERAQRLANLEEQQADRTEAFREQQAVRAEAYREEQADLAAAHTERIADLKEQYVLEEGLLKERHKKEEKVLKDRFKKELIAYGNQADELEGILGDWHMREQEMVEAQLGSHLEAFEDWLLGIGEGIAGLPIVGDGGGGGGGNIPPGTPGDPPPYPPLGPGVRTEYPAGSGIYWFSPDGVTWVRETAGASLVDDGQSLSGAGLSKLTARSGLNLALLAANQPGGLTGAAGAVMSFTQTNSFPGLDGATAAEVAALVRPQTIELLEQYSRGY